MWPILLIYRVRFVPILQERKAVLVCKSWRVMLNTDAGVGWKYARICCFLKCFGIDESATANILPAPTTFADWAFFNGMYVECQGEGSSRPRSAFTVGMRGDRHSDWSSQSNCFEVWLVIAVRATCSKLRGCGSFATKFHPKLPHPFSELVDLAMLWY